MSVRTACRRAGVVAAAAAALVAGSALPALAHVTIQPGTAPKGGWTKIAFRVPNERDDASTTKLEVSFPTDHPLAFVSVKPVPGWDVKVAEGKLPKPVASEEGEITEAVLKITWSGGKIEPGQFQEFEVSAGPLPKDVDRLFFPATQTYSSGEVVRWADEPKADGSEADHPVPVLKLVAAADDHQAGTAPSPSAVPSKQAGAVAVTASSGDTTARVLGALGIVIGLAGAGLGVLGLRRSRS
ncbi:YcnI family protein [Thermoactinospora rubra]|uniref:YcnI family copper-binding membrane protein n=1 Tax=Thermoactinospora rubra TaxID=1088767 RepID=UPI000A0FBE09|nr:YcnI family protein [Thermoactinospora rubra]